MKDRRKIIMYLKNIEELSENTNIKEKLNIIEKLMDEENYEEAYYKLAAILEYINIKLIRNKLNINIKDSDIVNIINIYQDKDSTLFKNMLNVNGQYNMVSELGIDEDDVIFLASILNSNYKYMLEKYGEFI